MALTNFAALTTEQKVVWSRDVWSQARNNSFLIKSFTGTDKNNVVQRITELTKTEKGEQALMFLVADLVEDGIVGDNEREGNEEALQSYSKAITIDLLSHQVRNKGKLSDQKSVINFREQGKDKLAYWLSDRIDQLGFLTMSGIAYSFKNNGASRSNSQFTSLAFASDVSAPTTNRHRRWNGAGATLDAGNTAVVAATDVPTYKMLTMMNAYAKDHYIAPLRSGGKEYYAIFMKPGAIMRLKNDADYKNAIAQSLPRDANNPFFTGAVSVTIDGLVIHEHRYVYSTNGASSGSKWGSGGTVNGTRTLLCGSQALGMADLGSPDWVEKKFQYDTQQGISVDKMFGLVKPKFHSIYDDAVEDFGVLAVDHALDQY